MSNIFTRTKFDSLRAMSVWVAADSDRRQEGQCVILIIAVDRNGKDSTYDTYVFTGIDSDSANCIDCKKDLSYSSAIDVVTLQMKKEESWL